VDLDPDHVFAVNATMTRSDHMGPQALAMTVTEFATALRISKSTAYALIRGGKVLVRKIGRRTIVVLADNDDFLRNLPFKFDGGK
jgi:plasmid maintenance system antidote protein VapI